MSKTYLKPINTPEDVAITYKGNLLSVKGKLGEGSLEIHPDVEMFKEEKKIAFTPSNELPETHAITGTMRALTLNLIQGVSEGFEKRLEITGVGYRAKLNGNKIELNLGFSHVVNYELPGGVSADVPNQNEIILRSIDKQRLGQAAAEIRGFRPPEPYKGKGIKYSDEKIRRKESKKA